MNYIKLNKFSTENVVWADQLKWHQTLVIYYVWLKLHMAYTNKWQII